MANEIDWSQFKPDTPAPAADLAGFVPDPEPEAPGLLRQGADLLLDFAQGGYGAIGAGASAFGADNLVAKGATAISDYAVELQSQQRQAERQAQAQRMQDAEATGSMWEEAKAAGQNVLGTPLSFFASALGSLVPTAAASVVGGAPAALTLGAGMGAGAVKQSVAERVEQEALKAGQTPEQAAAAATAAQAYQGDNLDQIALGAGLGALAGGTGVERLMGGGVSAIKNLVGRAAAGAVTEAVPEAVQGGQERLAANVAAQREGFGGDTWTGVVGQGVTEGLASTGPGGIAGAMTPYIDPNAGPISRAAIKAQEQQAAGALPAPGQLSGEAAMQMGDSAPGQDPTGALDLQRRNTELQDARAKQEAERAAVDPTYLDRLNGRQAAPQQTTAAPVTDAAPTEQGLPFTQPPYAGPAPTAGEQGSRWADPRVAIAGEPIPDPAAQLEIDRPSTQDQFLAAQRKRAQGELLSQQEAALLNGPDPFEGQTVSLASPADPAAIAAREEAVQDVAFANGDEPANVRVFSSQDLPDGPSGNQRGAGLTRPAAAVIEGLGRLFGTQYRFYYSPNAATRGDGFVLRGRRPGVAYVRATEGDAAPLVVAGHETYHTFTAAERARFSAAIEPFVDVSDVAQLAFLSDYTGGRYQAKVVQLVQAGVAPTEVIDAVIDQAQQDGTANLTRAALREEFDADIFGNRMKDTGFWEKVFTELKAQDRTLLVKIRDSIKQVVSYLKSQAGKVRGFDTDRYIRDLDAVQRIAARTLLSAANTQQKGERGSRGAVDVVRSEVRDRLGPYPSESFANMNKDWYAKKEGVQYAVEQAADGYYLTRTGATNEGQGQTERGRAAGAVPDAERRGSRDASPDVRQRAAGGSESAARQSRTPLAVESRVRTDADGRVSLTGVHFSRQPRTALSGSYYGTGLKGAEGRRLQGASDRRLLSRVYVYVNEGKGVKPEAGVGSYPHTVELSNLYDFAADPLKLIRKHQGDLNAVESAILDEGFDGYYVRDAFGNQGAAVVLGDASIGLRAQQVEAETEVVRTARRAGEDADQVLPTRWPTAVGAKPSVSDPMLADLDTLRQTPKQLEQAVNALVEEPGMRTRARSVEGKLQSALDKMVANLLWLHDLVPADIRARSKLWYEGAGKIATRWAKQYGKTRSQAAGILAVLSPQKDWFMNVTMGERVLDILSTQLDHRFDDKMKGAAFQFLLKDRQKPADKRANSAAFEAVQNKTLREVIEGGDLLATGVWLRAYDEAHHAAQHAVIHPEGDFGENATTVSGSETLRAWGGFDALGKAASIFIDGSAENINAKLGGEHKVRNFYNNIYAPKDARFVTIDTHAVAADLLRPLAGVDKPVADNFGNSGESNLTGVSGTYPIHYEAYKRAAEARGILPREMQSITWEAVRGLFTEGFRGKKGNLTTIDNIWRAVDQGKLTVDEARAQILEKAGGMEHPDWWGGKNPAPADARAKSYQPTRPAFAGTKVVFEVAPDPNDRELTRRWGDLPDAEKRTISYDLAWATAGQVLAFYNSDTIKGELHTQVGGYLEETNPSFSLWMNKYTSQVKIQELARVLGYVLKQDSMVVASPKNFKGATEMGAVVVHNVDDGDAKRVYDELRAAIRAEDGSQLINGHTTAEGGMAILVDLNDLDAIAQRVADYLGDKHDVSGDVQFVQWPERGEDEYGLLGSSPDLAVAPGSPLRTYADRLRAETEARLEQRIREAEAEAGSGKTGTAAGEVTRSTRRNELGFYSQLSRAVDASKFQTQPAGQWKLWLASNAAKAGVKADEVQWSGINEWLELQGKRKVEKAEVLQYLKQGGVQVQEVQKTAVGAAGKGRALVDLGWPVGQVAEMSDRELEDAPLVSPEDLQEFLERREAYEEGMTLRERISRALDYGFEAPAAQPDTRYADWRTPGGENYREVLLTLPGRVAYQSPSGAVFTEEELQDPIVRKTASKVGLSKVREVKFKSNHWDEKNVLAHIRLDDRIDAGGKRVLFVQEIQSDWGQEGRKKGFAAPAPNEERILEINKRLRELAKADQEASPEWAALTREKNALSMVGTPAAPFVTDTKSWVGLALKRVVSMATEEGYDRVAIVSGQQAADIFDLSQQVDSLQVHRRPDGFRIIAERDGHTDDAGVFEAERLPDVVGKELADKITQQTAPVETYTGDGLKVGGEGMKAFYDRLVPQVARDVLKKLGGQLQQVPVVAPYRSAGDRNTAVNAFRDQLWAKYGDGFMLKVSPEEEAQLRAVERGRTQTQLGFDITPTMREMVTGDGLPLFSAARTRFEPETHRDFQRDLARAVGKLNGKSETSYKEGYHQPILVMRTPPVLRSVYERAKANSRPFRQSDSVVGTGATIYLKSQNKFKGSNHGRPVDGPAVQRLPYLIADPLAVFQSTETGEDPNSFKVLGADSRGFFVAAIKPGYTMDGASKKTNFSATIFPVQLGQVTDWVKKGALRYWDDRLQKAEAQGMTGAIPGFLGPLSRSEGAGWLPGGPKSIGEIFSLAKAPVKIITRSELEGTPETMLSARRAQTETPEFKRWFGDSKVVDAAGQPRVVYHGTRADIAAFDPDAVGRNFGLDEVGFFFTSSPIKAASYADPESAFAQAGMRTTRGPEEGANIIPAYLSLQNPLTLDDYTDYFDSTPAYEIDEQGISITDYFDDNRRNIISVAQEGGHDGVLFQHRGDLLGVVFSPAQIKSATGNSGAFNPADPDITRSAPRANFGDMTQAQEDALRAVGLLREPKTVRERFAELTDNLAKRLTQGVVDQYAPLKELDFRSYVLARMSKGTDGTFEAMLYYGRPQIAGDTVEIDTAPGGLMEVLSTLSGEQDRFLAWIAANRAEQLTAEGREFLFTPEQIRELKGLNQGQMADGRGRAVEYARVLREFNTFQDSVLAIAEARGLIDAESRQVWRDGFYVPFYRNMEDGTTGPSVKSGLVNQYAFKKLKGSSRQLNEDLLANTLQNMAHLLSAASKNQAASASLRAAESAGVAHRVPSGTKGAVRFLDAGREQHYLVDDPFIYDAITSLESVKVVGLEKVLSKFKHWLTLGVTINPAFQLRSLMRDAIQSIAITNIDTNPLANVKQGIASQLNKDQDYINALASGGLIRFNSLLEGNRADHTRKLIKMGVADSTILDTREKVEMFFTKALDKWLAVGDISESTNRMALYKQQIAAGVDPLLAAYQARDLMDFSMQGQWRAVRFLTQVVPFLNARLQGLYKLGRDGVVPTGRVLFGGGDATDKQIAKRFGAVTGAVAMASIALVAAYADDEDWKKREDWDRDTYWWFKIGDTAFRIPKPFEVGAIGTIAERTAELFMTDDLSGDRFLQRLGHMMSSTFALNPIPQMVKPLLDVYANEESFTQRPIETLGMERLQPQDRFTGSTSELAKWLGQLGLPEPGRLMSGQYQALSPVQIDALIRGYFSWLGVSATRVVDLGVRAVADRPARPEMQLRDVFFAGNFVEGLPANSSRYVTALYDQSKAIESAYASYRFALRQGDQARATELLTEDGDKIRLNPLVTRAKQTMSKLNENIRAIERNMTMSPVEKRAQIDRIKAMQNQIAMRISAQLQ